MPILGFGIDLVHLPRFAALVGRRGPQLARRILSSEETWLLATVQTQEARARFLAVRYDHPVLILRVSELGHVCRRERAWFDRWAAKEALYKAVQPTYTPTWKDVSILPHSSSSPKPQLSFSPTGTLAKEGLTAHLSVSHDGEYLIAGVVVEKD